MKKTIFLFLLIAIGLANCTIDPLTESDEMIQEEAVHVEMDNKEEYKVNSLNEQDFLSAEGTFAIPSFTDGIFSQQMDIGELHNQSLATYIAKYGGETQGVLYSQSKINDLVDRLYKINKKSDPEIFTELEDEIKTLIQASIPVQSPNTNGEDAYQEVLKYQLEQLLKEKRVSKDLVYFVYDNSKVEMSISDLKSNIKQFKKSQTLTEIESNLLDAYLNVYLASSEFWLGEDVRIGRGTPWFVRVGDAWGSFVLGSLGTAFGPIGTVAGAAVGGQAMSAAMEYCCNQ